MWPLKFDDLTLQARFTNLKHVGVFPEQSPHWRWMQTRLKREQGKPQPHLLQSLRLHRRRLAGRIGSRLRCDARRCLEARDHLGPRNQLSRLADRPIRWILDDATKYVTREIRRGVRYDAVLLDPPSFGRGPNRELWRWRSN